jgi:tRNA A-37 threonylcarbamoyl transferase component Bud32
MSSLEDRLRQALATDYRVEREIARGGSAVVFLAVDATLDRTVAIKVLRPELATARAAARFLREARLLAQLAHPNVVPIHRAGEAGGLVYYVMDHVEGETLRDRLERGPLASEEALGIARQILGALQVAHDAGVVHRDVKPENILLAGGRALLADFGIARSPGSGEGATMDSGALRGTPGYMAPEQAEGLPPTPRSDVYSLAEVLYEALSGGRWHLATTPDDADWSGIPPPIVPPLRRALEPDPERRWPDAASFRRALAGSSGGTGGRGRRVGAGLAIAVVLLAAAIGLTRLLRRSGTVEDGSAADLALLPCRAATELDSTLGRSVARIAALDLEGTPGLRVRSSITSFRWWGRRGLSRDVTHAPAALHVRHAVDCTLVRPLPDSLEVRLWLVDASGRRVPVPGPIRGPAVDPPQALGDAMALALLGRLDRTLSTQGFVALAGRNVVAVKAFLRGEDALERRGDWPLADSLYEAALATDSSLALARWRLAILHRFELKPTGVDLRRLLREQGSQLGPLDRRLLAATILPRGPAQFAAYEAVLRDYPRDIFATMLFADQLYHRGALWGIPLDSAAHVWKLAVEQDSFFQTAWEHLAEVEIRLGHRSAARAAVNRLRSLADSGRPASLLGSPALFLRQAWIERFEPDSAAAGRGRLFGSRPDPDTLLYWSRLPGPYLDLARTELEMGRTLLAISGSSPQARLSGHLAQGLALMSMGRPQAALARIDSAARVSGRSSGPVEAAAWRVVPDALGFPGIPQEEVDRAAARLRELAEGRTSDRDSRNVAAWALSLRAYRRHDLAGGDRWADRVGGAAPSPVARRLRTLLAATRLAARSDPAAAITASDTLLAYDSAAALDAPFARATLHLLRGDWQTRLGRPAAALASLTWQENSDLEGAPGLISYGGSLSQAGEVDWALGTEGRLRAAEAALRAGSGARACRYAREVLRLWTEPEPGLGARVAQARDLERRACRP